MKLSFLFVQGFYDSRLVTGGFLFHEGELAISNQELIHKHSRNLASSTMNVQDMHTQKAYSQTHAGN